MSEQVRAGRFAGKVAFVTGAARGVGRAHAVRLAEEGADIIAVDVCKRVVETGYPAATPADLAHTADLVRGTGHQIVTAFVDVRDYNGLRAALQDGVDELGRLDVVIANAGVSNWGRLWELSAQQWRDMIDINLTGVFHTLKAVAPILIEQRQGGSIVAVSSACGLKALPGQAHYVAAKHGVAGLVKAASIELAPHRVRVNSLHPWSIDTDMARDTAVDQLLEANPSWRRYFSTQILTDPPTSTPQDIAAAGAWLASDEARTVTGTQLSVDHGVTNL